jgi:ABC-type bacteriocin/lantibiotic exporter with double-glycine peptidase domain
MVQVNFYHIYTCLLNTNKSLASEINLKELFQDKEQVEFVDIAQMLEYMQEDGPYLNLNFLGHKLNREDIKELLNVNHFPVLVYKEQEQNLTPFIIERKENCFEVFNGKTGLLKQVGFDDLDLSDILVNTPFENVITALLNDSNYVHLLKKKKNESTFNKLLAILSVDKKDILTLFFYAVVGGIVGLTIPLGIQSLINFLQMGRFTASGFILIILIVFGVLASGALHIVKLWIMEIIQQRLFARTAFDFINKIPKLSNDVVKKIYPPEMMNRFFDIVSLQKGLSGVLIDLSASVLQIVFGLIILSFYHPIFIAFSAVLIIIVLLVIRYTGKKALQTSLEESDYKYQAANWLQQVARARDSFRSYSHTNLYLEKMDVFVSGYVMARKKHFRILVQQYMAFIGFSVLITAGLLIMGYVLLLNNSITLGQLVASEIIILLVVNSIEKLIFKIESIYDILTSVEKISKVAALPTHLDKHRYRMNLNKPFELKIQSLKVAEKDDPIELTANSGEVVRLYFPVRNSINNFNEIFTKQIDEYNGEININSVDIRLINTAYINHISASFSNKESLFDGTLKENITIDNRYINDDDIMHFFTTFNYIDILNKQPEGLSTEIIGGNYNWGNNFLRIIILARCVLKKPKILIIDELLLPSGIETEKLKKFILDYIPNNITIFISNRHV